MNGIPVYTSFSNKPPPEQTSYTQDKKPEILAIVDNTVDNVDKVSRKMWTNGVHTLYKNDPFTPSPHACHSSPAIAPPGYACAPFCASPLAQGGFFWFRPFLSRKKRTKRKSTDNEGAGAQARSLFSFPLRFLFFGSFFSFPERKERTSSLRPFLSGKKRTKRKSTDNEGAGAQARSLFSFPLRFLFFGSFFSFPERKERTSSLRPFLSGKKRTKRKSMKNRERVHRPAPISFFVKVSFLWFFLFFF